MGRGRARERVEFSPEAETERSGVCSDEAEAQRCEDETEAGGFSACLSFSASEENIQ